MIPWFVARIASRLAPLFGRQAMTVATVGRWGADRIVFVKPGDFASVNLLNGLERR